MTSVKIIECPRDAMQGLKEFIPTDKKSEYINALLRIGFDTLDFGSFVSPQSIPQLHDTSEVLKKLNLTHTKSKLLAIVANVRGAKDACLFDEIKYIGFPFSISETFQKRNTNSTIEESLKRVEEIQNLCVSHKKEMVIYISMAFGNPYNEAWNKDIAIQWTTKLADGIGVRIIALSDTIGVSNPENISYLFSHLISEFPQVEFGAHLHTTPNTWKEKIVSAVNSGCSRFDTAIRGLGGCPMATDKLIGNMPTENLISYFSENDIETGIDTVAFSNAQILAERFFSAEQNP